MNGFSLLELIMYLFLLSLMSFFMVSWWSKTYTWLTITHAHAHACVTGQAICSLITHDLTGADHDVRQWQIDGDQISCVTPSGVITYAIKGKTLQRIMIPIASGKKRATSVVAQRIEKAAWTLDLQGSIVRGVQCSLEIGSYPITWYIPLARRVVV